MGIISGKDLFSSKFITAMIIDVSRRLHVVPIRHVIGENFFLAMIDKKLYCFRIDPSRIIIYYHTAIKSFRILIYDTNHYLPISPENIKELENILHKNSLPRVDHKMMAVFRLLGKREKTHNANNPFTGHDIIKLIQESEKHKNQYEEEVNDMVTYLRDHLEVEQILDPVRKLSEFLDYEIKLTDPGFGDILLNRAEKTELENKKMTNTEITGKGPWLKLIVILVGVGLVIGVIVWGVQSGAFNNIFPHFGNSPFGSLGGGSTSGTPVTTSDYIAKYPTPESVRDAINNHTLTCQQLPKEVHDMVDTLNPKPCP